MLARVLLHVFTGMTSQRICYDVLFFFLPRTALAALEQTLSSFPHNFFYIPVGGFVGWLVGV